MSLYFWSSNFSSVLTVPIIIIIINIYHYNGYNNNYYHDGTGVWFMHCHREEHLTWGMKTVFIVKNGESPQERLLPPPPDVPPC